MSVDRWTGQPGGQWNTGSNWNSGAVPGPDDIAVITTKGTIYASGTDVDVSRLVIDRGGAVLRVQDIAVQASEVLVRHGELLLDGASVDATLVGGLAGDVRLVNDSTFDDCTIKGPLNVRSGVSSYEVTLTISNGFVLEGADGTGAGALNDAYGALHFTGQGTTTIDHAAITCNMLAFDGPALSVSSDSSLRGVYRGLSGADLFLQNGQSVVNRGVITGYTIGSYGVGSVRNFGSVRNLGSMTNCSVNAADFSNSGTVTGGYFGVKSFSNTGTISFGGDASTGSSSTG